MERNLYDIQCTNRVDTVNIACIQGRYKEETWEKILILSKDSCMKFLCAYFKNKKYNKRRNHAEQYKCHAISF